MSQRRKTRSPWARLKENYEAVCRNLAEASQQVTDRNYAIADLLKLKDTPTDGKWDHATIRRLDEIRKMAYPQ